MMILGLLPLAVGRLFKISGTIRESIDGSVFMGLDVLEVLVVESLGTLGLSLRRRCGVGGPHRVPPPIWILCGRGRARGALVHDGNDGPSDRSHWEFDLRNLLVNLRHSFAIVFCGRCPVLDDWAICVWFEERPDLALARDDFFFLLFASASLSMARAALAWASRSSMSSEDDPSNE